MTTRAEEALGRWFPASRMDEKAKGEITLLLESLRDGHTEALDDLVSAVYHELRRTASILLGKEERRHTLHTTDLVHEAYLRLFDQDRLAWQDRCHFFGSAAQAMRRVLIDQARRRQAGKRIPQGDLVPLELAPEPLTSQNLDLLALDEALVHLADLEPRQARIVELRYFAGLTESEVAEILEVSRMTVSREWRVAKLWLRREMTR